MSNDTFYLRNPEMTAVSRGSGYLFLRPGLDAVVMSPVDAETLSQLLDELLYPMPHVALEERVDQPMIDFLVEKRILVAGTEDELLKQVRLAPAPQGQKTFRHLVFGLTGAVASIQVTWHLFQLARYHCEQVDVILTESAQKLLRPEALQNLGLRVWTDMFSARGEINVPHIHLAQAAEMVVIMPASAHTLYKLAHGACSDLLSLTVAATTAPVVLVPAMNAAMWTNPAVARNVAQLREDGMYVVSPAGGVEVSNAQDEHADATEVVGGGGILLSQLPRVLAAILNVHRSADLG